MVKTRSQSRKVEKMECCVMLHKLSAIDIDFYTNPERGRAEMMDTDDDDEKPFLKKDFCCLQITNLPRVSSSRIMNFEAGGKIIMPEVVLLSFYQDDFSGEPLMFRLTHKGRSTHCGVLEFTAEADSIIMPTWMMENLEVEEGNIVTVESVKLPKATTVKLKTSSAEFLQRYDPKPMLEARFVHFTCLTEGDKVSVLVKGGVHQMTVIQTQPESAVCIIDCDLNVEFESPASFDKGSNTGSPLLDRRIGIGKRLDGKQPDMADIPMEIDSDIEDKGRGGGPDLAFSPGNIRFQRESGANKKEQTEKNDVDLTPFCGIGRRLDGKLPGEVDNHMEIDSE